MRGGRGISKNAIFKEDERDCLKEEEKEGRKEVYEPYILKGR